MCPGCANKLASSKSEVIPEPQCTASAKRSSDPQHFSPQGHEAAKCLMQCRGSPTWAGRGRHAGSAQVRRQVLQVGSLGGPGQGFVMLQQRQVPGMLLEVCGQPLRVYQLQAQLFGSRLDGAKDINTTSSKGRQ